MGAMGAEVSTRKFQTVPDTDAGAFWAYRDAHGASQSIPVKTMQHKRNKERVFMGMVFGLD
jgi:hypothetical protein